MNWPLRYQELTVHIFCSSSYRTELKLFASIVRCKSLPGIETRHNDIDMVLIRENTEGEYSNLEHEVIFNLEFLI